MSSVGSVSAECVFIIADLAGYTALTEAHGGEEAANVVDRYQTLAESVLAPGAKLVERVGDQLLFVAADAASAVSTAVTLRAVVAGEPRFPGIRVGLHRGPAVERNGRYFGTALNLAARLAGHAREGEILGTREAAEAAAALGMASRSRGEIRFKNVPQPVEVFEILPRTGAATERSVDPVCQMQLTKETASAEIEFAGTRYLFCSAACAAAFAAEPRTYT